MKTDALRYLERGFSVIPVRKDKKPLIPWQQYQHQAATEDQVQEWWKKWPSANVGIVTGSISGLSVIDVDEPETGIPELMKVLPDEPMPTVRTPRGGQHFYFQAPAEPLGNNARIIPGCDYRGDGGYVVAPASMSSTGGVYQWQVPLDKAPLRPLPETYIQRVKNGLSLNDLGYSATSREHYNINTKTLYRGSVTTCNAFAEEGTRDDALFRVANALRKGGLQEAESRQVIEILAQNCNPPFPVAEAMLKVDSALKRAGRRENSVSEEVQNFVSVTNGYFSVTDCYLALQSVTDNRTAVRVALHRLVERGIIERWGEKDGVFRRIDTDCEDIDFLNAPTESLHVRWPLSIERYFRTLPKNIIVLAGQSDSGKTAFLLNLVRLNMDEHQIHYFSSEMGPVEFRDRLSKFPLPLSDWRFTLKERSSNFADVIKPDAVNIIDFLELHDDFYKVGGQIKDIFDRLNKGIAVIALQKNAGTDYGLGGQRSLEKARLYLSMEPGKVKIVKAKNWACSINPNRLECDFKIVQGCEFHTMIDWHKP